GFFSGFGRFFRCKSKHIKLCNRKDTVSQIFYTFTQKSSKFRIFVIIPKVGVKENILVPAPNNMKKSASQKRSWRFLDGHL
ncbi:MAG: hypothetical protein AAGU23_03775, partial [Bacillota bacterium]